MILFHSFILSLRTTIRPKIRILINLLFLFVQRPFDKVRGHSYSLIYSFLNCANISFVIFMADTALIFPSLCCFWKYYVTTTFRTLYSWKCCSDIFRTLYPWLYEILVKKIALSWCIQVRFHFGCLCDPLLAWLYPSFHGSHGGFISF